MSSFDATYLAARITETQPLGRAASMPPLAGSSPRAELTRLTRLVESLVAETNTLRSENARATRELRQTKSVLVDLAKYLKETGVLTNLGLLQKVDSLIDDRSSSASWSPSEEGMGPLAPLIEEASRQESLPSAAATTEDNSPSKQRPPCSKGAAGDLLTPRNAVKHIRDAAREDMHHSTTCAAAGGASASATTHASPTERACLPRAHSLHAMGSCKGDLTPRSMAKLVSLYPPPPPNYLEPTRSGGGGQHHELTRCASLGTLDWSFEGSALDPLLGTHDVASPLSSSSPAATMPRSPWSAPILASSTVNTPHALPDLSLSGSPHKPPPPPPSSSKTPLSPPQTKTHTHPAVCKGKWLMLHMHRYTSTASSSAHAHTTPTHTPTPAPPPAAAAPAAHTHAHAHAHTQHTTHTRTPALPQPPAAAYPVPPPASQPPPPPPAPTHTHTPVSTHTPSDTHTPATHTAHTTKRHHDTKAQIASAEEGSRDRRTPPQPPAGAQQDPCVRRTKQIVTNPLQSFTRRFTMIKPPPTTATVEQEKEYLPRPFGLRRTSTCPPAIPGLCVQVEGDDGGGGV